MITRTFNGTKVVALVCDTVTCELSNETVIIPARVSENKLEKVAREMLSNDTVKFVSIVSTEKTETLMGMSEADFMKYAVELDPETRKPIEKLDPLENADENETEADAE